MCSVSMISDYYYQPHTPNIWASDYETLRLLKEAIDRLDQIDKRLKDVECMDEKKAAFLEELDKRLNAIQKQ